MRRVLVSAAIVGSLVAVHPRVHAQAPQPAAPLEFDVVSIKRNTTADGFSRFQTTPDGGSVIVNAPIPISSASPVPGILPANVLGLPDWVRTERYDITARPPAGSTRDQIGEMWRTLFAKRMKLEAHIEEREAKVFSLVIARADGRLGPGLKKSTLDCTPGRAASPPPPPPQDPPNPADVLTRCGMMGNGTSIVTGGMAMDALARNISGRAGGPVTNKTGLEGFYTFTLKYAQDVRPGASGDAAANPSDDPEFFTALQEQLGLKIVSEKGTVPYFIIDHIERPTDN